MSTTTFAPAVSYRAAARRPQVRLTRRGRLVVFAFGMLMALAIGIWLAAGSAATGESGEAQVDVVTVAPGDTLWDIAADATAGGDVRSMMEEIRELNALDSSVVYSGQDLLVPTAD